MPDGLDQIGFKLEAIGHALSDRWIIVPVNQRDYAWEDEHVTNLFEDFAKAIRDNNHEYFLGCIVSTTKDNNVHEVVDGQQRLSTTAILLAAIRDYLFQMGDTKRAGIIQKDYLLSENLTTLEYNPRIRMNSDDNEYFCNTVLVSPDSPTRKSPPKPLMDSHQKILRATHLAKERVKLIARSFSPADATDTLLGWVKFISEHAKVIWVSVGDQGNAFEIFETLNDRGAELSKADLLKNRLFGAAGQRIDVVQHKWSSMMGTLRSVTDANITVDYIRHLFISKYGPTREKALYISIKSKITGVQNAVDFAHELADNATTYAAILNADHEMWQLYGTATRDHVRTLSLLRMERLRPLLLSVISQMPVVEAKRVIRLMVSWSVRLMICGGPNGTIESKFGEAAHKLRSRVISDPKGLMDELSVIIPGDIQFKAAFAIANSSTDYLARYYLRALEDEAKGFGSGVITDPRFEYLNLEHVLPEHVSEAWSQVPPEVCKSAWKRLGNMVLLHPKTNAAIGASDFLSVKAPRYRESQLILTREVGESAKWDLEEINSRQLRLAELAIKVWPLK